MIQRPSVLMALRLFAADFSLCLCVLVAILYEDMDFGPQQIGKWLISMGVIIALLGGLMIVLGRVGLFKLPGDLEFGSKNWRIYFPIASCIIVSVVLTLILWLIHYFRR